MGFGVVKSLNQSKPNDSNANDEFVVVGCGPIECRKDNEESKDFVCFCEDQITNVYMIHLEIYEPPNAPKGSTGWSVEAEFVGVITGTGDIGPYQLVGVLPNTIAGCPVYVSFRYLCVNSAVTPSGGGTAIEDFLEIATTTLNGDQLAVLDAMQAATGLSYPSSSWLDIYFEFNFVFLLANPSFELDLSGLGLSDLSLINTFTNLKHINLNDNKVNGYGLQQIDRLNLITMKMQRNALGMNDLIFLLPMNGTLKHIDAKSNNIQELRLLSFNLDYLDVSDNVVASIDSGLTNNVKDFRFNNNVYPSTVGFWLARKTAATSATKLAGALGNLSGVTNFEISNTEMDDPVNNPITIITKISVDKGISYAAAELIFRNFPSWIQVENILGHAPYDPTVLK